MTTTELQRSPALRALPRISARAWMVIWGITAVLQVLLLANNAALDTFLWRTTRWFFGDNPGEHYSWSEYKAAHANDVTVRPFYMVTDPPLTRVLPEGKVVAVVFAKTDIWWRVFKSFAENITVVILIATVAVFNRRRWKAGVMLLCANLAANGGSTLIRLMAGRYRPDAPPGDGFNHWELWRGFHDRSNLSWPSGHATVAFATAAVLIYLSPAAVARPARYLFLLIAAGTAYSRVVQYAHFYSDVVMAAAVGFTLAWLTCQVLDRVIRDPLPLTADS